jgi:hypothetical protein
VKILGKKTKQNKRKMSIVVYLHVGKNTIQKVMSTTWKQKENNKIKPSMWCWKVITILVQPCYPCYKLSQKGYNALTSLEYLPPMLIPSMAKTNIQHVNAKQKPNMLQSFTSKEK